MEIISIIISTLATVFTGGSLLFIKQDKRAKELDNDAKASDEWRTLYNEMRVQVANLENDVNDLKGWVCYTPDCSNRSVAKRKDCINDKNK